LNTIKKTLGNFREDPDVLVFQTLSDTTPSEYSSLEINSRDVLLY